MNEMEKLLKNFINNEDFDEGNDELRAGVKTLKELRFILTVAKQKYEDEYEEILDALISL